MTCRHGNEAGCSTCGWLDCEKQVEELRAEVARVGENFSVVSQSHKWLYGENQRLERKLEEARALLAAAADFIEKETPKQHECDMLTDRGPCKRCDFQMMAHRLKSVVTSNPQAERDV